MPIQKPKDFTGVKLSPDGRKYSFTKGKGETFLKELNL